MSADIDTLLAPNNPKEFEELCQHVLEHRFRTLDGQAYAGPGSPQHGVDFVTHVTRSRLARNPSCHPGNS
jgi:hypothetical protein